MLSSNEDDIAWLTCNGTETYNAFQAMGKKQNRSQWKNTWKWINTTCLKIQCVWTNLKCKSRQFRQAHHSSLYVMMLSIFWHICGKLAMAPDILVNSLSSPWLCSLLVRNHCVHFVYCCCEGSQSNLFWVSHKLWSWLTPWVWYLQVLVRVYQQIKAACNIKSITLPMNLKDINLLPICITLPICY